MDTITITPKTSYYAGDIELWDMRRIAIECGVSKTRILSLRDSLNFPEVYAVSDNNRAYYPAEDVKAWMLATADIRKTPNAKGKRRVGRPVSTNRGVVVKARLS